MLITIYIMLLLLNKLIDTGYAGGAISPLRSSRKERKQEGGDIRLPVARQGVKPLPDPTFYHDYVRG